ncbi:MAG: TIGR03546 family protein [Thermoguttaceae bacterium]
MSEPEPQPSSTKNPNVAIGVAIGMLIGLLPKFNLIVLLLCLVLYFLRTNLLLSIITIVFFTLLSPFLDPIADPIGQILLSIPPVQTAGSALYSLSFGPWTNLNNSLVCGQLVIGLLLFFPVFFGVRKLFR